MGSREEQGVFEFEASGEEYRALQRMADIYIYYLEATIPPTTERVQIVADVRAWQRRPRSPYGDTVRWECSRDEAIALFGAASCYSRLVVMAMPYSEGERKCKDLVMAVMERYKAVVMSMLP